MVQTPNQLTPDDLKTYIRTHNEREYVLVDVRQPAEYQDEHIPGAFLLPLPALQTNLSELDSERDLIFYCRSGKRSMAAATLALEDNVTGKRIYNLVGGIMSWQGKTLAGFPKARVFSKTAGFSEMLYTAMEMEKGAARFYDLAYRRYPEATFAHVFGTLSKAETAHARTIYKHWAARQENPISFEQLFDGLKENILESGDTLDQAIKRLDSPGEDICLNLIELALDIESAAFDLYRTMSDRTEDQSFQEIALAIAQAEKSHMQTLIKALEKCTE